MNTRLSLNGCPTAVLLLLSAVFWDIKSLPTKVNRKLFLLATHLCHRCFLSPVRLWRPGWLTKYVLNSDRCKCGWSTTDCCDLLGVFSVARVLGHMFPLVWAQTLLDWLCHFSTASVSSAGFILKYPNLVNRKVPTSTRMRELIWSEFGRCYRPPTNI